MVGEKYDLQNIAGEYLELYCQISAR
jgi:hypothetical protein